VGRKAPARTRQAAGRGADGALDGARGDDQGARALLRRPRRAFTQLKEGLQSIGATTVAGINAPAPSSPFNVDISPHRRYTFVDADLATFKAIKDSLGER